MLSLINLKLRKHEIKSKRAEVSKLMMLKSANIKDKTISTIATADLKLMFQIYDQVFFGNWFKNSFTGKLKFSLSRRMTKSAGLTLFVKNKEKKKPEELSIEIRIGVDFFFHYNQLEGNKTVGGVKTSSSLEALQLVFEHELCHVLEFIEFKESNCSKERFKLMASNLFGHTESYHQLPTHKQIANQKLGLKIGDTVSFKFEADRLTGILYKINKRATVMVRDNSGTFVDDRGNRYSKYYVPLKLLDNQA